MTMGKNQAMYQALNSFSKDEPRETLFVLTDDDIAAFPKKYAPVVLAAAKPASVSTPVLNGSANKSTKTNELAEQPVRVHASTANVDVIGQNYDVTSPQTAEVDQTSNDAEPTTNPVLSRTEQLRQYQPPFARPKIKVFGIGGAGNNIVDDIINSIQTQSIHSYIDFYQVNTDAAHLSTKTAPAHKILLTVPNNDPGHGSGGDPQLSKAAVDANKQTLQDAIGDARVCILVAGMGKGTGTGASPQIAALAHARGALTLAFATLPTTSEGPRATQCATQGIKQLAAAADAVCTIDNQQALFGREVALDQAYRDVSYAVGKALKAIVRLILNPHYQNVDFADVKNAFLHRHKNKGFMVIHGQFAPNFTPSAAFEEVLNVAKQTVFESRFVGASYLIVHFATPPNVSNKVYEAVLNAARKLTKNPNVAVINSFQINPKADACTFEIIVIREGDDLFAGVATENASFALRALPSKTSVPKNSEQPPMVLSARHVQYGPRSLRYEAQKHPDHAFANDVPEQTDEQALAAAAADYTLQAYEDEIDGLLKTKKLPGDTDTDDVRRVITQGLNRVYGQTIKTFDATNLGHWRN